MNSDGGSKMKSELYEDGRRTCEEYALPALSSVGASEVVVSVKVEAKHVAAAFGVANAASVCSPCNLEGCAQQCGDGVATQCSVANKGYQKRYMESDGDYSEDDNDNNYKPSIEIGGDENEDDDDNYKPTIAIDGDDSDYDDDNYEKTITERTSYISNISSSESRSKTKLASRHSKKREGKTKKRERAKQRELFCCGICGKVFTYKTNLARHQKAAHAQGSGAQQKPRDVAVSKETFQMNYEAARERLRHREVKQVKCELCGKVFQFPCLLKKHSPTCKDWTARLAASAARAQDSLAHQSATTSIDLPPPSPARPLLDRDAVVSQKMRFMRRPRSEGGRGWHHAPADPAEAIAYRPPAQLDAIGSSSGTDDDVAAR